MQGERKIADLVEEEGSALSRFEPAALSHRGAGKRSALVAKELCIDQVLRKSAAVDGHEGARGAAA